jgi:hypothetical protein
MIRRAVAAAAALAWAAAVAATVPHASAPSPGELKAEEIVAKNVAARGGLERWRRVETMAWAGHVQDSSGATPPMPFIMQLQRPNKTHFEISSIDKHFSRIFDGTNGWRVRPGGSGLPDLKPFSKEEVAFSHDEFVIGGPLIDYSAKGVALKLAGLDQIEGRKAYLLEVTLPGGASRRIWIDAETFLDFRSDRPSTSPLKPGAPVSVYYRDFRSVDGLLIPHTIETRVTSGAGPSQTLVIDRVALNPKLSAQAFAKPPMAMHRNALVRAVPDPEPAATEPAPPNP